MYVKAFCQHTFVEIYPLQSQGCFYNINIYGIFLKHINMLHNCTYIAEKKIDTEKYLN